MSLAAEAVVVLTFWDPWEAPHGGTLRTRAFCDAFVAAGSAVTCIHPASASSVAGRVDGVERVPVPAQTVGHRRWPSWAQRLKRYLLPMPTALGARSPALADAVAAQADADVLVVSHLSAVQYHALVPSASLWLDQSDLWSSFAAREASRRRGPARFTARRQQQSIVAREDRAVREAAVVSAAGWADAEELRGRTGRPVHWLPTALTETAPVARPDTRRVAGYFANFAYHPNVDALDVLVERWLPDLRARGWSLLVAGLRSDGLDVPDDVEVLGPVAHVDDFYRRVNCTLAPVRLGGGMKVKVIESLLKDRPVVATDFAVDGFPPDIRRHTVVVDIDRPDLAAIDDLNEVMLDEEQRRRFTPAGFERSVCEALGR